MQRKHNSRLTPRARELRKSMTPQEKHLWYDFLRDYPVRFRRQMVIDGFIADFYCHSAWLAVEIDGAQHYSEQGLAYDNERTAIIEGRNIKVIRFTNSDVDQHFNAVCETIDREVRERMTNPTTIASQWSPSP